MSADILSLFLYAGIVATGSLFPKIIIGPLCRLPADIASLVLGAGRYYVTGSLCRQILCHSAPDESAVHLHQKSGQPDSGGHLGDVVRAGLSHAGRSGEPGSIVHTK